MLVEMLDGVVRFEHRTVGMVTVFSAAKQRGGESEGVIVDFSPHSMDVS